MTAIKPFLRLARTHGNHMWLGSSFPRQWMEDSTALAVKRVGTRMLLTPTDALPVLLTVAPDCSITHGDGQTEPSHCVMVCRVPDGAACLVSTVTQLHDMTEDCALMLRRLNGRLLQPDYPNQEEIAVLSSRNKRVLLANALSACLSAAAPRAASTDMDRLVSETFSLLGCEPRELIGSSDAKVLLKFAAKTAWEAVMDQRARVYGHGTIQKVGSVHVHYGDE